MREAATGGLRAWKAHRVSTRAWLGSREGHRLCSVNPRLRADRSQKHIEFKVYLGA